MAYNAMNEMWVAITMGVSGLLPRTCDLDFERAEDGSVLGTFTFDASMEWAAARLIMHLIDNTYGPVTASKGKGDLSVYKVSFTYPPTLEDPIKKAEASK
ncbi:hypothetical protein [Streptomyces sp. NPDC005262]|uniref:hypothetical protein n=1 Tax=Streptomyces sp. NPDC005262 TaxID=3364710 RepID=UPI00369BF804